MVQTPHTNGRRADSRVRLHDGSMYSPASVDMAMDIINSISERDPALLLGIRESLVRKEYPRSIPGDVHRRMQVCHAVSGTGRMAEWFAAAFLNAVTEQGELVSPLAPPSPHNIVHSRDSRAR